MSQAADNSVGKNKAVTQKKKLKVWVIAIKLIVQQKM